MIKKDISFSENTFFKIRVNHDNKNHKCILFLNLYTATVINMFWYLIFASFSFSFKNKITIIVHRTLSVSQLKLLNNISGCKFVFIMTWLLITWHIKNSIELESNFVDKCSKQNKWYMSRELVCYYDVQSSMTIGQTSIPITNVSCSIWKVSSYILISL